jgi:O-antigen ligase
MNTGENEIDGRQLKLLEISGKILPYLFGIAFSFSSYTYVGVALTLLISAWYLALGWKKVLRDRWSLIVIGFFLAITCKDAVEFVLGNETFAAFAKSGSRIFVLAGSAVLILAYPREKLERAFLVGYGIAAAWIGLVFILMRLAVLPWIYNYNEFGDLAMWFPLLLGAGLYKKGDRKSKTMAIAIFVAGLAILCFDAVGMKIQGSRTAPVALFVGFVFTLLSGKKASRWLAAALLFAAIASIVVLSLDFIPKIDTFLEHRQELWQAYWTKGLERPFTGWGFTQAADNIRLIEPLMRGKPYYESFIKGGSGPHNSFLAIFFENGILALLGFVAILFVRIKKASKPLSPFDIALIAYIGVISMDAMMAGGLTYLGYFLGICILAVGSDRVGKSASIATPRVDRTTPEDKQGALR